jgi:Protein of unknown function (DUF1549)/Protein of unknown function (DUF1553)/Planctomycete cytochrome C
MRLGQQISGTISIAMSLLFTAAVFSPAAVFAQTPVDFAHEVMPLLKARCAECHSNGTYQGGFSIDDRQSILESGMVDPEDPASSELLLRVRSTDADYQMPPEGARLTGDQAAALERWIAGGLEWEPGFTFRQSVWQSPIGFVEVTVPDGEGNPIDRLLAGYLEQRGVESREPVSDGVFIRRVSMDLIGLLPTMEEQEAFFADTSSDKRERLVDSLLSRKHDYADHWMTFWNDLLRNDYEGTGYIDGGRTQITRWLHRSLYENKPYNQFVRELIVPTEESAGFTRGIQWRGNVNASQSREVQFSQNVAQVFLGENLKCASCHDSFIDNWKLADAWGLAAVFSGQPMEMVRCDVPTGVTATPSFLWPELGTITAEASREQRLAELATLITGDNNGRFARTIANRIWQRLMGRGIVEPVDSMSGEPFSPQLLDHLANELKQNGYDLKQLIRLIATSDVYQWPAVQERAAPDKKMQFSGPVRRRLTSEQFLDAVWQITETGPQQKNAELEDYGTAGTRVRASLVVCDLLMRDLGRPNREQVVTTRDDQLSSLQALSLNNGTEFHRLLRAGAEAWLKKGLTRDELARQIFRAALTREPLQTESRILTEMLGEDPGIDAVADTIWSVLLLPEFMHVQ